MKMPKEFYKTRNYEADHTRFGGYVRYSDFDIYPSLEDPNGYHTMASIAKRIEEDFKFDERCKKNIKKTIGGIANGSKKL